MAKKIYHWEIINKRKTLYATDYAIALPGISIKEFLINDSLGEKFQTEDVNEAFSVLLKNGLIIRELSFRGDPRFIVADNKLSQLILDLNYLSILEFRLLEESWDFREPSNEEQQRLVLFLGEYELNARLKQAEISRGYNYNVFTGETIHLDEITKQIIPGPLYRSKLEEQLRKTRKEFEQEHSRIAQEHAKTVKENSFLNEVLGIGFPSLFNTPIL